MVENQCLIVCTELSFVVPSLERPSCSLVTLRENELSPVCCSTCTLVVMQMYVCVRLMGGVMILCIQDSSECTQSSTIWTGETRWGCDEGGKEWRKEVHAMHTKTPKVCIFPQVTKDGLGEREWCGDDTRTLKAALNKGTIA